MRVGGGLWTKSNGIIGRGFRPLLLSHFSQIKLQEIRNKKDKETEISQEIDMRVDNG